MQPSSDNDTRFCPLCNVETDAATCAEHDVPTVSVSALKPREQLPVGTVVDASYRIEAVLGAGGMGKVYEATQLAVRRRIALKMLLPEHVSADVLRRFYREAQVASRLRGPQIVHLYAFGVDETIGAPYIAMELLDGPTLRQVLTAEGPLPPARVQDIVIQIAHALVEAESEGVVHRDLKPENIFLTTTRSGQSLVKVADFGIATVVATPLVGARTDVARVTRTGQTLGTPRYMAPEQILGQNVDHRSDLYALGCVMHEMLTGAPPFLEGAVYRHVSEPVSALSDPLPSGAALPAELATLHARLLAKEPAQRPSGGREILMLLQAPDGALPSEPPGSDTPLVSIPTEAPAIVAPSFQSADTVPAGPVGPVSRRTVVPRRALLVAVLLIGALVLALVALIGLSGNSSQRSGPAVAPTPSPDRAVGSAPFLAPDPGSEQPADEQPGADTHPSLEVEAPVDRAPSPPVEASTPASATSPAARSRRRAKPARKSRKRGSDDRTGKTATKTEPEPEVIEPTLRMY